MTQKTGERIFLSGIFAAMFCAVPVLGVLAPRAMAFLPALAGIIGFAACYFSNREWPRFNGAALAWASALVLLIALGSLWGIDPSEIWERVLKTTPLFYLGIVLMAVVTYAPREAILKIQKIFPYCIVALGVICVLELATKGLIYPVFHDVLQKISEDSLSFLNRSIIIWSVLALTIFFLDVRREFKYITAVLIVLVLLLTESQSVQLAMGLALITAFLPVQSKILCIALCVVTSTLLLGAPFLAQWLFHDVAAELRQYAWFREGYAADRTEIWDFVARRALERPIFGHGIEATRLIKDFDIAHVYFPSNSVLHPHNFALQVWIEFGAIGAVFFSGFLSFLYYQIWVLGRRSRMAGRFCLTVMAACLCMAATSYGLWQGWWLGLFSYVFALCFMLIRISLWKEGRE